MWGRRRDRSCREVAGEENRLVDSPRTPVILLPHSSSSAARSEPSLDATLTNPGQEPKNRNAAWYPVAVVGIWASASRRPAGSITARWWCPRACRFRRRPNLLIVHHGNCAPSFPSFWVRSSAGVIKFTIGDTPDSYQDMTACWAAHSSVSRASRHVVNRTTPDSGVSGRTMSQTRPQDHHRSVW